jgi:NAD(P)-dependent dehydrogenase (short-subunit alcohol dehydrogenase family)
LALCDVNESALTTLVEELTSQHSGSKISGKKVDVSSSEQVNNWIQSIVSDHGALHGAANIAGVEGRPGAKVFANLVDIPDEQWDFVIGVNLTGLFYCLRAELRVMGQGGSILNVASIAGLMGRPGIGAYGASKHGVVGLTRTAAKENGPRGIRVNGLAP